MSRLILALALSFVFDSCSAHERKTGAAESNLFATSATHHFELADPTSPCLQSAFSTDNDMQRKWNSLWGMLQQTFGPSVPEKILVKHNDGDFSMFNPPTNSVLINDRDCTSAPVRSVAHESAHLSLAALTNLASIQDEHRFFDEGYANIFGYAAVGQFDSYKQNALSLAAARYSAGQVSFALVQKWADSYRETSGSYEVGSSFDFYLWDRFSEEKLKAFFEDIGRTHDLAGSLLNVFGMTKEQAEHGWQSYLAAIPVPPIPKIVEMYPADGSSVVPCNTPEIHVTFDVPMNTNVICVLTPGPGSGLDFHNASWSGSTLTLKVDPHLVAGRSYSLSLGVAGQCLLRSAAGREFPATPWTFRCQQ